VISAVIWASVARELRAQVLSLRERDHIQALRAMGGGAGYVLVRHVVPAVAPLVIADLTISYGSGEDRMLATNRVSLSVAAGELLGLVGESGSGKSTIATAACGLLPAAAVVEGGRVIVCGHDLATLPLDELRAKRGDRVALIPQEAMSALNPVLTIADQIAETITAHHAVPTAQAHSRVGELLASVGLDPARSGDYPHQLSGGMRQRVVIAMALANDPAVVIADEPTSGLDVLVQADVLNLLDDLRQRLGLALLVVSHDLPVIECIADRVAIMRAGQLVEVGPREQIVTAPQHPYTRHLLDTVPRLQLFVSEANTR
jgi:peptide/nickel transport system permease protein